MLSKKDLSKLLKVTERTINRYMEKGMPFIKLPTGTIRFTEEEVMKWLKGE